MSKKRYFYYIKAVSSDLRKIKKFIIKASDSIEAMDLIKSKINTKLEKGTDFEGSDNAGLMIQRISKKDKNNLLNSFSSNVKYVKNFNVKMSKLKAFEIIKNGMDLSSDSYPVRIVYAKTMKKAIKDVNKKYNYAIGELGFYSIKKIENEYK